MDESSRDISAPLPEISCRSAHAITAYALMIGAAVAGFFGIRESGESIAGILLGPSLLGRVAPEVANYVLPGEVAPYLGVVAQLGVILYMSQFQNGDWLPPNAIETCDSSRAKGACPPFETGSCFRSGWN